MREEGTAQTGVVFKVNDHLFILKLMLSLPAGTDWEWKIIKWKIPHYTR